MCYRRRRRASARAPCGACKFSPAPYSLRITRVGACRPALGCHSRPWRPGRQPTRYIEPPLPPAPPSMRKARSRQSSPRSLASCVELGVLERGLRGDRRWSASLHRCQQALLPWHLDSQAVCATAPLLTAAATLVARRHVIRTVRIGWLRIGRTRGWPMNHLQPPTGSPSRKARAA